MRDYETENELLLAEIDELKILLSKASYSITDGDPETKEDCIDEIDAYFAKHKGE